MRRSSIILALIALASVSVAAPTGSPTVTEPTGTDATTDPSDYFPSSSSSSARKLPTHEVGLPSELAWQAWLVVANKPDAQSSFESATVPRRISPKSVFVAPALQQACSDGYVSDSMGRCVRETIQINYKSHLEFILDRLRAKFPSTVEVGDSSATGPGMRESAASGPLQVNISLGIEENLSASRSALTGASKSEREVNSDEDAGIEISVVSVPGKVEPARAVPKPDGKTEAALTACEVSNGTENAEDKEGTFFRNSSSLTLRDHSISEVVVPVAEFVDDGNRTFAEVIDYEIPLSVGQRLFNDSSEKPFALAKNITETKPTDDAHRPTLVLLLSPTALTGTGTASTPYFKETDSLPGISTDHVLVRTGNLAVNSTRKGGIPVNVTELNLPSGDTAAEEDEEATPFDDGFEDTTTPEVPENLPTTIHPEDEPDDATEFDDEILAHGEAGMLVSAAKFRPEEPAKPSSTAVVFGSKKTAEESGGSISSESSISGDVILETTLLDLNTGTAPRRANLDDLPELFEAEKDLGLVPEVVFSPQDARGPSTRGKKRAEDHAVSSQTTKESFSSDPGDSSTFESRPEETVSQTSRRREHSESDGPPAPGVRSDFSQRRRTTSGQGHVRFPEDPRQPSSSYALFASDRSNSINGNVNYKERTSPADESARPQSMPKSSVTLHQKKTYWHLPPGWRIDDLQPPRKPVSSQNGNNQRQNPMLFRFWTRMPLFRDPSLTISNQSSRVSPIPNQRDSIYRGISPQAANRAFGQTVRGGGQAIG